MIQFIVRQIFLIFTLFSEKIKVLFDKFLELDFLIKTTETKLISKLFKPLIKAFLILIANVFRREKNVYILESYKYMSEMNHLSQQWI